MSAGFETEACFVAGLIAGEMEAKVRWSLALNSHGAWEASCRIFATPGISGEEGMTSVLEAIREVGLQLSLRA